MAAAVKLVGCFALVVFLYIASRRFGIEEVVVWFILVHGFWLHAIFPWLRH